MGFGLLEPAVRGNCGRQSLVILAQPEEEESFTVFEASERIVRQDGRGCTRFFQELFGGRKVSAFAMAIADAKEQTKPLRFSTVVAEAEEEDNGSPAGRLLSPDDVRQLTVYAELDRRKREADAPASLMLLYPYIGTEPLVGDSKVAWNGSPFHLVPVSVRQTDDLAANLGI